MSKELEPIVSLAISLMTRRKGKLVFQPKARAALLKELSGMSERGRVDALHSLLVLWKHLDEERKEAAMARLLFAWIGEATVEHRAKSTDKGQAPIAGDARLDDAAKAFIRAQTEPKPKTGMKLWATRS